MIAPAAAPADQAAEPDAVRAARIRRDYDRIWREARRAEPPADRLFARVAVAFALLVTVYFLAQLLRGLLA